MARPYQPTESSVDFLRGSTVFAKLPAPLFDAVAAEFEWVSFDQGAVLFSQGDASDRLFFVVHGRLAITRRDGNGAEILIGWVRPGESVGEMALLEGAPRTATVRAARDTVTISLRRADFEALAARVPECLIVINDLLARRLNRVMSVQPQASTAAEILGVIPASRDAPVAEFSEVLCRTLEKEGAVLHLSAQRLKTLLGESAYAAVMTVEQHGRLLTWLNDQEARHRFIVLEADADATAWTALCVRQCDEVLLVARAGAEPGQHVIDGSIRGADQNDFDRPRRLILIHDDGAPRPSGTIRWLDALRPAEHHHVRFGVLEDMERLGRFLRRQPVSLALAGGAALGLAHIGVLRALFEAGIPIDLVCGTSMGAIVGGQVALGMQWEDVFRETKRHFHGRSIYDATLPVISLFKARRMDARLQKMVGDVQIEDLWGKFFCVSSNLTKATPEIHDRGNLKRAIRASAAVPGLFPPVLKANGDLLVDGALLNNLPADVALARNGGSVIAVNVIPTIDRVSTGGYKEGVSALHVLLSRIKTGTRPRSPLIADLLLRAVFLPTVSAAVKTRAAASLYIEPSLEGFRLFHSKRFDEIVDAGYVAALEQLRGWRPQL